MTASRNLVGSWKVLSFWIEFENSEDRDEPFGANPDGYVVLTETRLTAVITGPNRKTGQSTDQLFETMMAYSGRYRLQGDDCFVTTVDSAWLPAWLGTEQVRYFKINGDELLVRGLFRENPKYPGRRVRGVLRDERSRGRRLVALCGRGAMSDLSLLCEPNRTFANASDL